MVVDRDADAVRVRVGGQHQVAVNLFAQLNAQLQSGFFLRVWIWAGREVAVRQLLFPHHRNVLNADALQNAADQLVSGAVERGVDHLQVALLHRRLADAQRKDAVQILVHQLVGDVLDHAGAQPLLQRDLFDPVKDVGLAGKLQHLGGSLRVELAAVLAVGLVAVILGGVVAGGDDDAGAAVQLTNRKGKGRGRHQFLKQVRLDAVGRKDPRGDVGKQIALDAAVIGDGHRRILKFLLDIVGHALGGKRDGINIHPVGAHAQNAAQSGGAELQHLDKALLDLVVVALDVHHLCNQIRIFQMLGLPNVVCVKIVHPNHPF